MNWSYVCGHIAKEPAYDSYPDDLLLCFLECQPAVTGHDSLLHHSTLTQG